MSSRGASEKANHGTRRRASRAALGLAVAGLLLIALWLGFRPQRLTEAAPSRVSSNGPRYVAPRSTRTELRGVAGRASAAPSALTGTVKSARGAPLRGASICALDGTDRSSVAVCSATDAAGRFELPEYSDAADTLVASAAGFLSKECSLRSGECAALARSVLHITLEPGGLEVSGEVVDALGGVVPAALVTLRSLDLPTWTAVTMADADGHFAVRVAEGPIEVHARVEGYSLASVRTRAPARGVLLVLAPEARLLGRVVNAMTFEPVADVNVRVQSIPDGIEHANWGMSDAAGTFQIDGLPGGGQYSVTARSDSWGGAERWVTLDVGQVSEPLILQVWPATTLTGTVNGPEGPCAKAMVAAVGRVGVAGDSAADGRVHLGGLLPGTYRISVMCPQALPFEESLEIGQDPVVRDWTLQSGLSVSGRVEGPRGRPVPGVVVAITPVGEPVDRLSAICTTNASGAFSCSGLSAGEYDCQLSDTADTTRERLQIALQDRPLTGLLLRTGAVGTIVVSVTRGTSGTSAGSNGMRVFARDVNLVTTEATRREDAFVFEQMPLGRYQVYIDLPTAHAAPADVRLEYDGQAARLELPAPELLSIAGQVLDDQGAPWLDAWVRVEPADALAQGSKLIYPPALSDEAGEFRLTGLVAGLYNLQVSNAERSSELRDVAAGSTGVVVQSEHRR